MSPLHSFVATTDDELFELLDVSATEDEVEDSGPGDQFNIELAAEHSVWIFVVFSPFSINEWNQFYMEDSYFFPKFTDILLRLQYLGDLQRVPGVQYLEPNKSYKMPIIYHAPLVFPGETIPMILPHNIFPMDELNGDGLIFGLVSREVRSDANSDAYGVTCQVYEKSSLSHNVTLKTRACQRFFIPNRM